MVHMFLILVDTTNIRETGELTPLHDSGEKQARTVHNKMWSEKDNQ